MTNTNNGGVHSNSDNWR